MALNKALKAAINLACNKAKAGARDVEVDDTADWGVFVMISGKVDVSLGQDSPHAVDALAYLRTKGRVEAKPGQVSLRYILTPR